MNLFEENWLKGTKFENHFKSFVEKSKPILGNELCQTAFCLLTSDGYCFRACNDKQISEEGLAKKNYLYQSHFSYLKTFSPEIKSYSSQFNVEDSIIYTPGSSLRKTWISLREQIDSNTQLITTFVSNNPMQIINALTNNLNNIYKLIKYFQDESKDILNWHQDHKFNLAAENPEYYRDHDQRDKTPRENTNYILQTIGILDKNQMITEREWQCLKMYEMGMSALKTGSILSISRRTVEQHFDNLKRKLKVKSKYKILEIIN